uniref:Uncharacterized protein n=1 Tax=Rhizophora mucronata TaxID=61149 RepID=A0A2P2IXX3_RHIMU
MLIFLSLISIARFISHVDSS